MHTQVWYANHACNVDWESSGSIQEVRIYMARRVSSMWSWSELARGGNARTHTRMLVCLVCAHTDQLARGGQIRTHTHAHARTRAPHPYTHTHPTHTRSAQRRLMVLHRTADVGPGLLLHSGGGTSRCAVGDFSILPC